MCLHRCWIKLYAKETLHLQGEYSLIIYNCRYVFEEPWVNALQETIFYYGFHRGQSPTCTICHKCNSKKKMAVQTLRSSIGCPMRSLWGKKKLYSTWYPKVLHGYLLIIVKAIWILLLKKKTIIISAKLTKLESNVS